MAVKINADFESVNVEIMEILICSAGKVEAYVNHDLSLQGMGTSQWVQVLTLVDFDEIWR